MYEGFRGGEDVKSGDRLKRGYYLRGNQPNTFKLRTILFVSYFDGDEWITVCNLTPDVAEIKEGVEDYLFFNHYAMKDIFIGGSSSATILGNYYLSQLPNQYNFINWNTNPLSSRK